MTIEKALSRIDELIKELDELYSSNEFEAWKAQVRTTLPAISSKFQEAAESLDDFNHFNEYPDDDDDMFEDAIQASELILIGVRKDIDTIGLDYINRSSNQDNSNQVNLTNNITQQSSQSVEQNVNIQFEQIIECFRDELTGKQLKELIEIGKSNDSAPEKKKKFYEKVKSFGSDVAAGIISGLLTNPGVLGQLSS